MNTATCSFDSSVSVPSLNQADPTPAVVEQPRLAHQAAHDVLATVAHELRTPLATMQVSLEMLAGSSDLNPEEVDQLLSRLQSGLTWLEGLAENLTIWAALETGHLPLRRSVVQLSECIESALALVQPLLERKNQQVRLSGRTANPCVYGDPFFLRQIVVNLLTNASKYSNQGDVIDLSVCVAASWVRVRVTDHGPGVAPGERTSIFGRYARGSAAANNRAGGLGLGLHIVDGLVRLHGGIVGLDSEPGNGASFWFRLPIYRMQNRKARARRLVWRNTA